MDNRSCAVLVPVYGAIEPETETALGILSQRGYVVRLLRGSSQVDLARSTLATQAMRDGFAETMWIDADIAFDPDSVDQLRSHNEPFVAGLYLKKGVPEFAGKFAARTTELTFGVGGELVEMHYVGMGFTLIKAEVYYAIQVPECNGGYGGKTVFPYFLPLLADEPERPCYLSEDFSFCYRARQAGYGSKADTTIRLGHIGKHRYGWDGLLPKQEFQTIKLGIAAS